MTETERHLADLRAILESLGVGQEAPAERLSAMAHRYLASSPEGNGRISPETFAGLLRSELVGRFVHQEREPSEPQLGRMLAAALRRASIDIEDRTYYVPCRLFDGSGPDGVAVGPVIFRVTESVREAEREVLAADKEVADLFEREFAPWAWAAEVTIRGCDRTIAHERALMAVDGALDILRLFAGARPSRDLGRVGQGAISDSQPAGFWTDTLGRLHLVRPERSRPSGNRKWLKRLHEPEGRDWLDRAGRCLEPLADPALNWPLAERFREAASWFGEAATETYRATRVVAFVTAIERAVVPGDHADVWRAVTRRAALLARDAEGGSLEEWHKRASSVYEIRSQIVHGGVSPFAPAADAIEPLAAGLARATLVGALAFYERLGMTKTPFAAEHLEKEYRALEAVR